MRLRLITLGAGLTLASSMALATDFETYMLQQAEQNQGVELYSANYQPRNANSVTPYTDQAFLPRIPKSELVNSNWDNLTPIQQSEVAGIVQNMRTKAQTNEAKNNAIGLRSGMSLYKESWEPRDVRNSEGLHGAVPVWDKTEHNITWYPDHLGSQDGGMRLTSGRFNMGSMPFVGQAHLDIPLENIRKDGDKVWFKADVNEVLKTTNLLPQYNYYKVFGVEAPILDFLGYYDMATGEWKIKFIIDSDMQIDPESHKPGLGHYHPKLDLEVYSQGYAL